MSYQESSGYCEYCQEQVLIRRKGTNHIFHLLMTLITCGFWIIIWLLISIKIGGWRCSHCGSQVTFCVPKVSQKSIQKSKFIVLALLAIIIFIFCINLSSNLKSPKNIMFSKTILNVRTGPGTNYEKIDKLTEFKRVEIIKKRGNWAKIKYDDKIGWVFKNYLINKKEKDKLQTIKERRKIKNFGKTFIISL